MRGLGSSHGVGLIIAGQPSRRHPGKTGDAMHISLITGVRVTLRMFVKGFSRLNGIGKFPTVQCVGPRGLHLGSFHQI
jgi:hypothetical protein